MPQIGPYLYHSAHRLGDKQAWGAAANLAIGDGELIKKGHRLHTTLYTSLWGAGIYCIVRCYSTWDSVVSIVIDIGLYNTTNYT